MKTVFYHGKIYLRRGVFAQALEVEDGRISRVGSDRDLLGRPEPFCRYIDCGGRLVIPGFHDSHMHLSWLGRGLRSVDLTGCTSMEELIRRGRAFLQAHPPASGDVLQGGGWNQDCFTDTNRFPERRDLDRISTEVPILFERACTHVVVCNTRALELARVTAHTNQPAGGRFELGEDGQPNGIFRELAVELIRAILPQPTAETLAVDIAAAMEFLNRMGITSVQSMDIQDENCRQVLEAFHRLEGCGKNSLRVVQQACFLSEEGLQRYLQEVYRAQNPTAMFRLGPLKLFADGSLGARTALLRQDYADAPGERGIACLSREKLLALVSLANRSGLPCVIHCIGDAAMEAALDAFEPWSQGGKNPLRNGIVHCQITDRALLNRMRATGTLALVQPVFLDYDLHIVESRVGRQLAGTSYAFQSMLELGIPVSYGTDAPVESPDPFANLYCAVTRQDKTGIPPGGFHPEERVDVWDALDCYTAGSAYAAFAEHTLGRLRPGYRADLAILDRDLGEIAPEELRSVRCLLTMVDGSVVYQSPEFHG